MHTTTKINIQTVYYRKDNIQENIFNRKVKYVDKCTIIRDSNYTAVVV